MNPVTLPMSALHHGGLPRDALLLRPFDGLEGSLVILRHDLYELGLQLFPLNQHTLGKIPPSLAEAHNAPPRHVLAAVVADAFHDRRSSAIAHREALAGDASEVRF